MGISDDLAFLLQVSRNGYTTNTYCHHTQANTHQLIRRQNNRLWILHDIPLDARRVGLILDPLAKPIKQHAIIRDAPLPDLRGVSRGLLQSQSRQGRFQNA